MQNDDITWAIINRHHCSFKIKTETQNFCRNEYSNTGLCKRMGCPLANSQYATVREHKGTVFLYIRMSEKVFTPCDQWKKIKLSKVFISALQQIEDNLVHWPVFMKVKCRQRLLLITKSLTRMRNMKLHNRKTIVPVKRKEERRFARREQKALIAAKLDHAIENQLINRLKQGTYANIYNFPEKAFNLRMEQEIREEEERDEMLEDEEEDELEEDVEEEEEEGETVASKNDEMEQELVDELERGLVRIRRREEESDVDSDSDDEGDMSGSDLAEDELEEEEEGEEEEDDEDGHVEYVADFDESDQEQDAVLDIEDAAERLQIGEVAAAGPSKPSKPKRIPIIYSDDEEDQRNQERIRSRKYGPRKTTRASKKSAEKKARRTIRAIYEKQKTTKEAKKIKMSKK